MKQLKYKISWKNLLQKLACFFLATITAVLFFACKTRAVQIEKTNEITALDSISKAVMSFDLYSKIDVKSQYTNYKKTTLPTGETIEEFTNNSYSNNSFEKKSEVTKKVDKVKKSTVLDKKIKATQSEEPSKWWLVLVLCFCVFAIFVYSLINNNLR